MRDSVAKLCTFTGESITVVGEVEVDVEYGGQCRKMNLVIVQGHGSSLFGRDWLKLIKLDWHTSTSWRLPLIWNCSRS